MHNRISCKKLRIFNSKTHSQIDKRKLRQKNIKEKISLVAILSRQRRGRKFGFKSYQIFTFARKLLIWQFVVIWKKMLKLKIRFLTGNYRLLIVDRKQQASYHLRK